MRSKITQIIIFASKMTELKVISYLSRFRNVKFNLLYSWVAYMWKIVMTKVYQNILYYQCNVLQLCVCLLMLIINVIVINVIIINVASLLDILILPMAAPKYSFWPFKKCIDSLFNWYCLVYKPLFFVNIWTDISEISKYSKTWIKHTLKNLNLSTDKIVFSVVCVSLSIYCMLSMIFQFVSSIVKALRM